MKPVLVIMAAGMGSRYGGIKQLDSMGPDGEILLDYAVHDALKAGFSRVVFVIRKSIEEAFRKTVGQRYEGLINWDFAFQELDDLPEAVSFLSVDRKKPWGTGHAILCCRKIVKEPFLVINADDFYGAEAFKVAVEALTAINPQSPEAFLVGYLLQNTLSPHGSVTRGLCEEGGGMLVKVNERHNIHRRENGEIVCGEGEETQSLRNDQIVSMNFWGFTPVFFDMLERKFLDFLQKEGSHEGSEFLVPTLVDNLIQTGQLKVKALRTNASWFGVTYSADKPLVKAALMRLADEGTYSRPLWRS